MYHATIRFAMTAMLLLALVLSGCGAVQGLQEATQSGTNFVNAIKDGQYAAAYALFHPELQKKVGTASDLKQMIEDNKAQPKEWSFTSTNAKTDAAQNQTAVLEGNVVYADGRQGGITLELLKMGNDWMVTSFNFTW